MSNPDKSVSEYLAKIGRKGGKKVTSAKKRANRERILKYWADVRAGIREKPKRKQKSESP